MNNQDQELVQELREAAQHQAHGEGYMHGLLRRAAARISASAQQPASVVRHEPSDDMVVAGMEASLLGRPSTDNPEYVLSIWRAMLAAPASTVESGTTSDKYRAELYDEVWQKARDMGYGNVTDALTDLDRIKAQQKPIAIKTHGAWDGLDGLDALLDGTAIYAGPAPETLQPASTCPSGDGSLRHPCPRHDAQDVSGLVEALEWCQSWFEKHCPTSKLDGFFPIVHPMLTSVRNALAAHRAQRGENK